MAKIRIPFIGMTLLVAVAVAAEPRPVQKLTESQKMHFRALRAEQNLILSKEAALKAEAAALAEEINGAVEEACEPSGIKPEVCEIDFKTGNISEKKPEKK